MAAKDVRPDKNVVGKGFTAKIELNIANQGHFSEVVNVTVYANAEVIASFTDVNLSSQNVTTIAFLWDTTSFDMGNYTIKSVVNPVPNEAYLMDNNFTYETVYVGVQGDVNGNHIVNMLDTYNIAIHFGASSGQPDYVANYDIEDNGIINMLDLYIAATHFGQTDP